MARTAPRAPPARSRCSSMRPSLSDPVPRSFWERAQAPDTLAFEFSGLVLASRSPQREALLRQLGVPFRIVVSEHAEEVRDGDPAHTVQQNARGKAEEVLARTCLLYTSDAAD